MPSDVPATDAVFVVLRRMRSPFIVVIVSFSVATAGMMLMPGVDANGNPYRLTLFDAFYQMAITLTTVGYSEVPHSFSYPQRMWLTLSLFMLVTAWAYAIGAFFSVLGEPAFRSAMNIQRFRRQIKHLREPFFLVAGYGSTGRTVGRALDARRRRFVVLDENQARIDAAITDPLHADVPALSANCTSPAVLGLAGLGHTHCRGVLALTNDDEANLAVVMSAALLAPGLPVIVRCDSPEIQHRIEDFGPEAVINPNDRFGGYLALAALRPVVHQLLTWLMENDQPTLTDAPVGLKDGRWVIAGSGQFAQEAARDLGRAGLDIERVEDPNSDLDLGDAAAFVAGTDNDLTNIAIAEHARITRPDIFVAIRNVDSRYRPLLRALDVDSTFIPAEIVARETLARIVTPQFWRFVETAVEQPDEWAARLRDRLVDRCGRKVPERDVVTLSAGQAPAAVTWLAGNTLLTGDLLRHPDDRETPVAAAILAIARQDEFILSPADDVPLALDDQVLLAGTDEGLADISDALFSLAAVEYVATGRQVPSTWVWRAITGRRRRR